MKTKFFYLYNFILVIALFNACSIHSQTNIQNRMPAFVQSALNSSRAVVQRNRITSTLLFLSTSYVLAETISYKYRNKTFFAGACKRYVHDVAYWALKKMLCVPGSPKPEVLPIPDLYKS